MQEYILKNKLKIIYKQSSSELTSICISLNAGAGVEKEKLGIAHATEHMVYKGTKNRSEKKINEDLSNIFGFNNAMTNYPYVIYYGTLLNEDFKDGVELLSDIITNPVFKEDGFKEEINVIKEELKEWDEELEQYCEDNLFFNSFENRRIKYPIIGTKESLESITLSDIKEFYNQYYFPENAAIVVISSVEFDKVKYIINEYFGKWENNLNIKYDNNDVSYLKNDLALDKFEENKLNHTFIEYEQPKRDLFKNKRDGIKTCKVEIICPIDKLSQKEMKALRIFNQYFGEGINSILYDTLRTQNGIIYDVITKISNENYIKLYKITFGTSKENLDKSLSLFNKCVENIYSLNESKEIINDGDIDKLIKSYKLKRLFREEQSIILAKELATYETMFGDYRIYIDEINDLNKLNKEMIFDIGKRVLTNLTVQIID